MKLKETSTTGNFDYNAFAKYLQGIAGGNKSLTTAKSITADIQRFINQTSRGSTTTDTDLLLSRKAIESYFVHLKSERDLQATTLAEKLRRIRMAIKFILHNVDSTPTGDKTYLHGQKLLDMIQSWCHSLGKAIGLQRQQHTTKISDEIGLTEEPDDFLDNEKLHGLLHRAVKRLETSNQTEDIKLVTAYCAAKLIYGNGQRSGVVENLTTEEFLNRVEDPTTGEIIIKCHHHKTGAQGIAQVVIKKSTDELMGSYYRYIRQHAKPIEGAEHLLFLTPTGRRYTQVYRKMQEAFSSINQEKIKLPAPSQYRILVRTDCSKELPDQSLRNIAKHMSHSSETARKYYEFSNTSDAINAHQTIVEMAKRRKWNDEETKHLLEGWPLDNPKPDLKTCQLIKERFNLERTPKNILDKWRQLKARDQ